MSTGSLTLPDNQVATLPLLFRDATGQVHAPVGGGSASSSDPSVATAAISADNSSVVITAVADGSCTISYQNDGLTDSLPVTVAPPAASTVEIDAADATFAAKASS